LVRVGLEAADPARADQWFNQLQGKLREFDAAMTEVPFGNMEKATPIAQDIIRWLDEPLVLLDQMARKKPGANGRIVDQATALNMLRQLGKIAAEQVPDAAEQVLDYESARQMAWAFRTIYHEWVRDADERNKNISDILNRLDQRLVLSLGPGPSGKRSPIIDSLGERLKVVSDYKPKDFVNDFAKLMDELPKIEQRPPKNPAGGD